MAGSRRPRSFRSGENTLSILFVCLRPMQRNAIETCSFAVLGRCISTFILINHKIYVNKYNRCEQQLKQKGVMFQMISI